MTNRPRQCGRARSPRGGSRSPTGPVPRSLEKKHVPSSRTTSVRPSRAGRPVPLRWLLPANSATKELVGPAISSVALPVCTIWPSDENPDLLGESGGVREVVRDEDRRQANVSQMLAELTAHPASRVDVERRQRLVEEEHLGVPGKAPRARLAAFPRRRDRRAWPGQGPGDAEAVHEVRPRATAEGHVALDGEMRKEGVLLEDVAHRTILGSPVAACRRTRARRSPRSVRDWAERARRGHEARSSYPPRRARRAQRSRSRPRALPRRRSGERGP